MQSIDFQVAQGELQEFLASKLMHEPQDQMLEKRAQRLADKWWASAPAVTLGSSGLLVTGCVLGFDLGVVRVSNWKTKFTHDTNNVMVFNPRAIPLGYSNGYQLYFAPLGEHWVAVARNEKGARYWKHYDPKPLDNDPIAVALARATALGHIDQLKEPV